MAWIKNGTPDTLTGLATSVDIADLSGFKFNVLLVHVLPSGVINSQCRMNGDAGSFYTNRGSENGAGDTAGGATDGITLNRGGQRDEEKFSIVYMFALTGEEKLHIEWQIERGAAGDGAAPARKEQVGKWVTAGTLDRFNCRATSNNYAVDSNLSCLGTD